MSKEQIFAALVYIFKRGVSTPCSGKKEVHDYLIKKCMHLLSDVEAEQDRFKFAKSGLVHYQ
jgi:hypothetical protein